MNKKYIAKTLFGLENILAKELADLGGTELEIKNRAVLFNSSLENLYKINLASRLSLRILLPIKNFIAKNPDQLYKICLNYDWSKIIRPDNTFMIDSVVSSQYFPHSKYVALKLKDAIVDQLRRKYNKRPNIDLQDPDYRINLHIDNENCTISLDSSGDSLHKRGYRLSGEKAPLNEILAAGMILLSGWECNSNFIDPMCGSGTLVIEAALLARKIPPNIKRNKFGFMKWRSFDEKLFRSVKRSLIEKICEFNHSIIGNDISESAIKSAKISAKRGGIDSYVEFSTGDFFKYEPKINRGILILNPPYGERLKQNDEIDFYKKIGDTLKHKYEGFDTWILSSNMNALKNVGLRTSRRIKLYNGSLECKYHNYKLYKGSKKRKYEKT